jgi:hypothetical protein
MWISCFGRCGETVIAYIDTSVLLRILLKQKNLLDIAKKPPGEVFE